MEKKSGGASTPASNFNMAFSAFQARHTSLLVSNPKVFSELLKRLQVFTTALLESGVLPGNTESGHIRNGNFILPNADDGSLAHTQRQREEKFNIFHVLIFFFLTET